MRPRSSAPLLGALSVVAFATLAGGCSSTASNETLSTSSLAPRPDEGLSREAPRINTAETVAPKPYTQPDYVPQAYQPRPAQYARSAPYGQTYAQAPYTPPQPYPVRQQPYSYGQAPAPYAQAPYGQRPYAPQQYAYAAPAAPQQQPYGAGTLQTGSLGRAPYAQPGAPVTTGSLPPRGPHVIEVREGDTLYGISRRTGVPVADLVMANRISGGKIAIGQKLVIPPVAAR